MARRRNADGVLHRTLTGKVPTAVMLGSKPWAPSACFFCIAVSRHSQCPACLSKLLSYGVHGAAPQWPELVPTTFLLHMQVAYTVGWTAVSSELTYYTSLYGPEILLWLNVSGCEPLCPPCRQIANSEACGRQQG